jgi:hypothetical protein
MTNIWKSDFEDGPQRASAPSGPSVPIFRRAAFALVVGLLTFIPPTLSIAALSRRSELHTFGVRLGTYGFPFWAPFCVWATLDAASVFEWIGPRPDPLGPESLKLSALGLLNILSLFLWLALTGIEH